MLVSNDPPAIPLWINGHAFLTLTPAFHDVVDPLSGNIVRRTPMCGLREALIAAEAARSALAEWQSVGIERRGERLNAWGAALATYAGHFSRLIAEETGKDIADADAEVAACIDLLRTTVPGNTAAVIGIIGSVSSPLLDALGLAAPALKCGATVIMRPSPATPSALFALAELSGQCGFPAGVVNIVHGGDEAIEGLRAATDVLLACP